MKNHRYKISFSITALIYIIIIISYVYMLGHDFIISQKIKSETINISLSPFTSKTMEKPIVNIEKPEPEPEPEPEIKSETKTKNKISIQKSIVKKKFVEVKSEMKKTRKNNKQKNIAKKVRSEKQASSATSKPATSLKVDENKRSLYLSEIREKINREKYYPKIAIRRGMQGIVKARFNILKNGHIGEITVLGPKVFFNSTKSAIKKSFPLNIKDIPLDLPISVNLSLYYQLY